MTVQIDGVRVNIYHHGDGGACIYVGEAERTGGDADRLAELLESDAFDGAASCSGSLWIDGWMDYIRDKNIVRDVTIYLSLGSKEERTKNPLMSTVGDCTRETYELLKKNPAVKKAVLQWNKGGHFADADARLVKGILWLLHTENKRC